MATPNARDRFIWRPEDVKIVKRASDSDEKVRKALKVKVPKRILGSKS